MAKPTPKAPPEAQRFFKDVNQLRARVINRQLELEPAIVKMRALVHEGGLSSDYETTGRHILRHGRLPEKGDS